MKVMLIGGEIMGTGRSEALRLQCSIVFGFGFSDIIQEGHDSNGGLDEDLAWRHDITRASASRLASPKALDLPLHEAIGKSRVISSGCNFIFTIRSFC